MPVNGTTGSPVRATGQCLEADFSSAIIRLIFRNYFFIVLFLIGLVAQRCCGRRSMISLLRHGSVPATHLTGWLVGHEAVQALFRFRAFPGGKRAGFLMIGMMVLHQVNENLTTTLINSKNVAAQCEFGTGMVIDDSAPNADSIYFYDVPFNGAPTTVAQQAQAYSVGNGGLSGVYRKVNRATNFCATQDDVLGQWTCSLLDKQLTFPPGTDPPSVLDSLYDAGLAYNTQDATGVFSNYTGSGVPSYYYEHLVILGSSTTTGGGFTAFNVLVSYDITPLATDDIVMNTLECVPEGSTLANIQKRMDSIDTFQDWKQTFQGALYNGEDTPASPDAAAIVAQLLNSMLMVAGGNNYLLDTSQSSASQGCLIETTCINWAVISFVSFATLCFLGAGAYCLYLEREWKELKSQSLQEALQQSVAQRHAQDRLIKDIEKFTPNNLMDWICEAVREVHNREEPNVQQNGQHQTLPRIVKDKDLSTVMFGLKTEAGININPNPGILYDK